MRPNNPYQAKDVAMQAMHQSAGVSIGQDSMARGEVSNQLMMLREMISQLESQVEDLAQKLVPISRGAAPLAGVEEKAPPIHTEVGMTLHDMCCRVMCLSNHISDLRNRVEI